jgi:ABC-2 type transport system permease protein
MNGIWTICSKELKTLFTSPVFYIISLLMTTVLSLKFYDFLRFFASQQGSAMFSGGENHANIHDSVFIQHLSVLNLILIFLVPALTMRLLAEERKLRTFDLLLTSPVTSTEIVLGKYFATLIAILIWMLLAMAYPISTRYVTAFSWAPLLVAFFGVFLLASVYAAMSLFCSSLTEQSLISFVTAVIFNIVLWFIGSGADAADSQWARTVYEHISLNTHLSALVYGTIRTSALVYLISLIAFFVFLTERVVESFRWRSL